MKQENNNIISELEKVLKKELKDEKQSKELLKANEFYNRMIEEGIIKKRGYTLRSINDTHLFSASIFI